MKNAFDLVRDIETAPLLAPTQEPPTFGETVGASLSFKYSPLINHIQESSEFGYSQMPEEGFVARQHIPEDLKEYGTSLLQATSQRHMDVLSTQLRNSLQTRETLAESGGLAQFGAEFFDLVNWVALPFSSSRTLVGALTRGGASTTAVVAVQEAIRYPLDPLATPEEVGFTLGSSFVLGGLLNGLVTIPARGRIAAQEKGAIEINRLREAIEKPDGVGEDLSSLADADASIASSLFTDSWLFKAVTTPMKRTLQDPSIPNSVKITMLDIANDSGILLAANKKGIAFNNSVFQNAKLREGEWVQTFDSLVNIWGESTGAGSFRPMDYMYKASDFEDWLTEVDAKSMRGEKPANDFEARAMEKIDKFYGDWEARLSESGLIGSKTFYIKDIKKRQARIDDISLTLERYRGTKEYDVLRNIIDQNQKTIDLHNQTIKDIDASGPVTPANEEIFRPRYWDKDYIKTNRAKLEGILADWFRDNPEGYGLDKNKVWTKVKYATSDAAIAKRASDAVDNILGMKDVTDFDAASFGFGKSKHMKHRGIDIPNKLVMDYMHRNPVSIMKAYTARTAARYEFAVKFDGQDVEDLMNDKMIEMLQSGASIEKSNAALKDLRHMYDRVAGTVLREPDTANQKFAEIMRTLAQLNYLGSAGLSTITEPARIVMEHGIGKTMKGLFTVLNENQLKMGAREARIAGEALEILMGSSHMRLVEDMGNNPLRSNYMDKTKNAFFLLNGLAPATRILKDFEGMMRSHTLIDYSVRLAEGKATKMEIEYLARYNIDAAKAKKIADSPWEQGESGLYMANTEAWTDLNLDSVRADVSKTYKISSKPIIKSKPFVDQPVEPELSFESKIEEINTRISELEEAEINAIKKGQTSEGDKLAKQINDAEKLRTNANVSLAEEVKKAKQAEKESQDYYESMQPGFEPDRKILRGFLDREQKAIQSAKALEEEIKDLDSAIENLEAGTKAEFELQNIVDKDSDIAKQRDDISKELSDLYNEITAREFLNGNGIDYDNLTPNQQKRAYELDQEEQFANMSDDDSEFGLAIAKSAEEARSKEVAELKESAEAASKAKPKRVTQPPSELMPEQELLKRFGQEFYVDRIITDQEIVDGVFTGKGTPNILGSAVDTGLESPATVYLNIENIRSSYNKFKNREDLEAFTQELDEALSNGVISESAHAHQMTYVNNANLLKTEDDFVRFVMMHELHHTTHFQKAGETLGEYEARIDDLALGYIKNERKQGLNLAVEKEQAARIADAQETQKSFRNALGSGIANTILMGTPADKPIITDGVAYIPMRVASQFGMKEDKLYKGYSRIENPLLGMPFQFMSYSLAAVNKTTAAFAHGQIKSQFIGTAMSMGLGYMLLQAKTPDYIEMEFSDQFARAFDYSGVAALYSDLFYTAMGTSLALGGPNLTGGLLKERFPQEPDLADAATGILGAGPSITSDIVRGMWELTTGNVGEGSKEIVRNLPFARLWFLKGKMNEMTRMLETELDAPTGFVRY